jgi:hypothetical protein
VLFSASRLDGARRLQQIFRFQIFAVIRAIGVIRGSNLPLSDFAVIRAIRVIRGSTNFLLSFIRKNSHSACDSNLSPNFVRFLLIFVFFSFQLFRFS